VKNKKFKTAERIAAFLILGILALGILSCKKNKITPEFEIVVDPRMELMSIIFRLAGNNEYNQRGVIPYVEDITKHFDPYKNHPAVEMAKNPEEFPRFKAFAAVSFSKGLKQRLCVRGEKYIRIPLRYLEHLFNLISNTDYPINTRIIACDRPINYQSEHKPAKKT
jgi:hypothetical protein